MYMYIYNTIPEMSIIWRLVVVPAAADEQDQSQCSANREQPMKSRFLFYFLK